MCVDTERRECWKMDAILLFGHQRSEFLYKCLLVILILVVKGGSFQKGVYKRLLTASVHNSLDCMSGYHKHTSSAEQLSNTVLTIFQVYSQTFRMSFT